MINRRDCLKYLAAATGAPFAQATTPSRQSTSPYLTPIEEIEHRVRAARPLLGGPIPADLRDRLGTTHYHGKYYFTEEPFLLEGCKAIQRLGMRVAKLWLSAELPGYFYHSDWQLKPNAALAEVARHPYFLQAFALPFSTFVLEVFPGTRDGKPFLDPARDYAQEEEELHGLAAYLLRSYADRDVTFILQHWEGDWMLRGQAGRLWQPGGPPDADKRCKAFIRWLAARQRGVSQARAEAGATKCRVYHAAEVNRVLDALRGIPTVTSHVLPHVAVDLVSWSSYDGMKSPITLWQGLELIRHYARPSPVFGQPRVYIGEVGNPEQGKSEETIVSWWDQAMGVFLAQQVPWIVHWELYCNEPLDRDKHDHRLRRAEELRGFWLIRPDGSLSYAGKYLKLLLDHAGGRLPGPRQRPA